MVGGYYACWEFFWCLILYNSTHHDDKCNAEHLIVATTTTLVGSYMVNIEQLLHPLLLNTKIYYTLGGKYFPEAENIRHPRV